MKMAKEALAVIDIPKKLAAVLVMDGDRLKRELSRLIRMEVCLWTLVEVVQVVWPDHSLRISEHGANLMRVSLTL